MKGEQIRQSFLDFFRDKGHEVVESDLLVPRNDPTLLFTGAGMNQFKDQFMGRNVTFPRAVSCQKCMRTGDLDNVGRTPRHHTFFEMLGNFSFGDYFKKEAISWGWEYMTRVLGLPEEKLWVSVYEDDDEAYRIWLEDVGVPESRIVRLGEHDNFWPADAPSKGPNGPCGPCSEIFFDGGASQGCGREDCDPGCGCDRFLEVWNLVFTQFDRKPDGSLEPLPSRNIDTGMGLERITAVVQGVPSNFLTDLFEPINRAIMDVMDERPDERDMPGVYLIADHIRAAVFAIGDGVSPSNEKQGYVVRKLIRRAFLKSGEREPFLYNLVPVVTATMKNAYPHTHEKSEHISAIVREEEERFCGTLDSAVPVLEKMLADNPSELSGSQIFKLVDTYGLPVEVIEQRAGVPLDMEGFRQLMDERKEQSRKGSDIASEFIFSADDMEGAPRPGYSDGLPLDAEVSFMSGAGKPRRTIEAGDRAEIVTDPQPADLYAESGGQAGDKGIIEKAGGSMEIVNTIEADGRKVLQAVVREGTFSVGDRVTIHPDRRRRHRTACNHTATHLLQAALRKVLGEQVKQSGSLVTDRKLRFDFTHMKKLSERELVKVQDLINEWVETGIGVRKETKTLAEAREEGALSFFGEKYGDTVRVVSVGDVSSELCGGTHVDNIADIGLVRITGQSAVASGIRRIEAVTGETAREEVRSELKELLRDVRSTAGGEREASDNSVCVEAEEIAGADMPIDRDLLRRVDEEIVPGLLSVLGKLRKAEKKKKKEKKAGAFRKVTGELDRAVASSGQAGGFRFISAVLKDADMGVLRKGVSYIQSRQPEGVIVLCGDADDKAFIVCAADEGSVSRGASASEMIAAAAPEIEGSGGGKDTFAQAGGRDPGGLESAVEKAYEALSAVS